MCDLLSRVQTLWAGTSAVQYGMAAIELELIIYRIQSLLCIFVTTVTYPPAQHHKNDSGSSVYLYQ